MHVCAVPFAVPSLEVMCAVTEVLGAALKVTHTSTEPSPSLPMNRDFSNAAP